MSDTSMRNTLLFGLSGVFLGFLSRITNLDLDVFHEISLIREAYKIGFMPQVDLFSYVPTLSPVVHWEWGAGAIFYLVVVQAGLGAAGLMGLKYLLAALIAIGCYRFSARQGAGNYVFSYLAFLGMSLGLIGFSTVRAALFTFFFVMIFLFLFEEDRKGKSWALWALLPVHVIWLNIHPGFMVGLGLLAVYTGEKFFLKFKTEKSFPIALKEVVRPSLFLLGGCILIVVNPYGVDYFPSLLNALALDRTPYILEWRPLWEQSWIFLSLFIVSLGVVLYCISKIGFSRMPGLFILAATAWLGLWHIRHLPIYAVVWTCYVPAYLEKTPVGSLLNETRNSKLLKVGVLVLGIMGLVFAVHNEFWKLRIPVTVEDAREKVAVYPAGAVSYLRDGKFSGNIMVPYNEGGYITWNLFPGVKVSMDSRFEIAYRIETVVENAKFYAADKGWREILAKYPTDAVLVPRWWDLDKAMSEDSAGIDSRAPAAAWQLVYIDDAYSLYMRSDLAGKYPHKDMRGKPIDARFP